MPVSTNVAGTWKSVNAVYTRVAGVWKQAAQMYVKVAGVWEALLGWMLGDATYTGDSFLATGQTSSARGVEASTDGLTWFLTGTDEVYQYTTASAWDVAGLSYASISTTFSLPANLSLQNAKFQPDGTTIFVLRANSTGDPDVQRFSLSTAWDLSTIAGVPSSSLTLVDETWRSILFNDDGTVLYLMSGSRQIHKYTLGGAYSLSGATYDGVVASVDGEVAAARDMRFKPDGTRLFVANDTNSAAAGVEEYTLSTAFDPSTLTLSGDRMDTSTQLTPWSMVFRDDGIFCAAFGQDIGGGNDSLYLYRLG